MAKRDSSTVALAISALAAAVAGACAVARFTADPVARADPVAVDAEPEPEPEPGTLDAD